MNSKVPGPWQPGSPQSLSENATTAGRPSFSSTKPTMRPAPLTPVPAGPSSIPGPNLGKLTDAGWRSWTVATPDVDVVTVVTPASAGMVFAATRAGTAIHAAPSAAETASSAAQARLVRSP